MNKFSHIIPTEDQYNIPPPKVFWRFDHSTVKGICPKCKGLSFKQLKDEYGQPFGKQFGMCDHSRSCGHKSLPQYGDQTSTGPVKWLEGPQSDPKAQRVFVEAHYVNETLRAPRATNRLYRYLLSLFPAVVVDACFNTYLIGTSDIRDKYGKVFEGAAVFWTIGPNGGAEVGEVVLVDEKTGSTVKGQNWAIGRATCWHHIQKVKHWVSNSKAHQDKISDPVTGYKALGLRTRNDFIFQESNPLNFDPDFILYCRQSKKYGGDGLDENLFGLQAIHDLVGDIHICESSKTAVCMWCLDYYKGVRDVWLGAKGMTKITAQRVKNTLTGAYGDYRTIHIHPDGNATKHWNPTCNKCWFELFVKLDRDKVTGGLMRFEAICSPQALATYNLSSSADVWDMVIKVLPLIKMEPFTFNYQEILINLNFSKKPPIFVGQTEN